MNKRSQYPYIFNSITELNKALGLSKPTHPLITIGNYNDVSVDNPDIPKGVLLNFYNISYKKYFSGTIRYGQNHYDFGEGGLSFTAPMQLMAAGDNNEDECEGLTMLIHPDFLSGYPLAGSIKKYGFFSYFANEALQLSEKEKDVILSIFNNIQDELEQRIDNFSQDIIINQLELLLSYSERFYSRQFIIRKAVNDDILTRMEILLNEYFNTNAGLEKGLLTVQYLADKLNISSGYLSDMLRNLTGLNAQQHIHEKLIEKAKEYLTTGNLSVAEIAYQLGFEHPQSFSKVFKKKTNLSPSEYKQSLN